MERKIGEIFECNGEWYQCLKSNDTCNGCIGKFQPYSFCNNFSECRGRIFKKLKKVGEPSNIELMWEGTFLFQAYKYYLPPLTHLDGLRTLVNPDSSIIRIEIKQNKEDMEEKSNLIELLSEKVHNAWMKEKESQGFKYGKEYDDVNKTHPDMLPYNELSEEVKEYDRATVKAVLQAQRELNSDIKNLRPFDLEKAKAGKPVCTRDGRKARIICFDKQDERPIIALIQNNNSEDVYCYHNNGTNLINTKLSDNDLMMLPKKKEGWVVILKEAIFDTEEEAKLAADESGRNIIKIQKVNWEE